MIKLIKEETIIESVTTQIIYKEAKIDFDLIDAPKEKNYSFGLFKNNPTNGKKQVYYDKYNCIEGGVNEFSVRIYVKGLVFKNDWYIDYQASDSYSNARKILKMFKGDNSPVNHIFKVVGINKEGYDAIPFITNEQVSEIVNIMNFPEKNEKPPILAVPIRLITINGRPSSETILANEDGSFPFLTMKDYAIAKELAELKEK